MQITNVLADLACGTGPDCPKIHDTDGPEVIVQGDRLDLRDPEARAGLQLPDTEDAVVVPRELVFGRRLTLGEMLDWIVARHTFHLVRVENRRSYQSRSDGGDFAAYLDGVAEPQEGQAWFDRLRESTRQGRLWTKLHVIHDDTPSDYERFEMEWPFHGTTRAGEVVKILSASPGVFADVPDFWVVDHEHVIAMAYDGEGRFSSATPITGPDAAVYRALARIMWQAGAHFEEWWAAHPEVHRRQRRAA